MPEPSIPLALPQLAGLYQALGPLTEALLRIAVGLAMVPHGLRMTFGFFPTTGQPLRNIGMLADYLDKQGYRPGKPLALAISATQLICGPLVALGLFTRPAAVPLVLFLLVTKFAALC
jgi:putative oxidoreductase